jgi:pyrroline-5-carboxylate reductase
MKLNKKIGFLGCGNMGEAILAGLLKNRAAQASHVTILESDKRKAKVIEENKPKIEPQIPNWQGWIKLFIH